MDNMQINGALSDMACFTCTGQGQLKNAPCETCNGSGKLSPELMEYVKNIF